MTKNKVLFIALFIALDLTVLSSCQVYHAADSTPECLPINENSRLASGIYLIDDIPENVIDKLDDLNNNNLVNYQTYFKNLSTKDLLLETKDITSIEVINESSQQNYIYINITNSAARALHQKTLENIGKYAVFIVDDIVISAARITLPLGGSFTIEQPNLKNLNNLNYLKSKINC